MKESYLIRSSRYGHIHSFKRNDDGSYSFVPAEDWMPLYISSDPESKDIISVDTEGGPFITVGWNNGEIEITGIRKNEEKRIIFNIREISKKTM